MDARQIGYSIGQFVPIVLIVALVALIVRVVRRRRRLAPAPPPLPGSGPVGFGGWLLLPAFGQCISPLVVLAETINEYSSIGDVSGVRNGRLVADGELGLNSAYVAFSAYVTVAMLRRSPVFPKLYAVQWVIAAAFALVEPLVVAALIDVPSESVSSLFDTRSIVRAAMQALWVVYMFRSERARNTFRPADASREQAAVFE